jgi:hypothetical protein
LSIGLATVFSLTGYIGILFVLSLVKLFGALIAATGMFLVFCMLLFTVIGSQKFTKFKGKIRKLMMRGHNFS